MKKITLSFAISSIVVLAGCSTLETTVLPQQDHSYTIIATASSQSEALSGAMNKANETCSQYSKKAVVINHSDTYQGGMDKNMKDAINTVAQVATMSSKNALFPGLDTSSDYKTNLQFKCE